MGLQTITAGRCVFGRYQISGCSRSAPEVASREEFATSTKNCVPNRLAHPNQQCSPTTNVKPNDSTKVVLFFFFFFLKIRSIWKAILKLEIIYRQFHNNMRAQFRPNAASGTRQSQMEQHQTRQSQPYWLNQDYLQSILSQNQELKNDFVPAPPPSTTTIILTNPVSQPVSTSCGPRGCTASLGSSSVSSGLPLAPVTRPTSRPTPRPSRPSPRPTRPSARPTVASNQQNR